MCNYTDLVFLMLFYRSSKADSALVSEESAFGSSDSGAAVFKLTYLEVGFPFWEI